MVCQLPAPCRQKETEKTKVLLSSITLRATGAAGQRPGYQERRATCAQRGAGGLHVNSGHARA